MEGHVQQKLSLIVTVADYDSVSYHAAARQVQQQKKSSLTPVQWYHDVEQSHVLWNAKDMYDVYWIVQRICVLLNFVQNVFLLFVPTQPATNWYRTVNQLIRTHSAEACELGVFNRPYANMAAFILLFCSYLI